MNTAAVMKFSDEKLRINLEVKMF